MSGTGCCFIGICCWMACCCCCVADGWGTKKPK
jgi:hypothetical protein